MMFQDSAEVLTGSRPVLQRSRRWWPAWRVDDLTVFTEFKHVVLAKFDQGRYLIQLQDREQVALLKIRDRIEEGDDASPRCCRLSC